MFDIFYVFWIMTHDGNVKGSLLPSWFKFRWNFPKGKKDSAFRSHLCGDTKFGFQYQNPWWKRIGSHLEFWRKRRLLFKDPTYHVRPVNIRSLGMHRSMRRVVGLPPGVDFFLIKKRLLLVYGVELSQTPEKARKHFQNSHLKYYVYVCIYIYVYTYMYTYLMTMMHEHDSCPTLLNPPLGFSTKNLFTNHFCVSTTPLWFFRVGLVFSKCHKANGNAPWCYFTRCRSGISRRGLKPWRWWLMMTWMTKKNDHYDLVQV